MTTTSPPAAATTAAASVAEKLAAALGFKDSGNKAWSKGDTAEGTYLPTYLPTVHIHTVMLE